MKQPVTRMWIDARNEKLMIGKQQIQKYFIKNLNDNETRKKLWDTIGTIVQEIRILQQKENEIEVVYDGNLVSASFLEYKMQLRGVSFNRDG